MMQNIDVLELALKCTLKSTTKSPQGAFSARSAGRFDGQVGRDLLSEKFKYMWPPDHIFLSFVEYIWTYRLGLEE